MTTDDIDNKPLIFLSIDNIWAKSILNKNKKYEYRRQPPKIKPPYYIMLYSTKNVSAIVGSFKTKKIYNLCIDELISKTIDDTPHKIADIKSYFKGKDKGAAIQVDKTIKYDTPIPIEYITSIDEEFTVPQNFRYIKPNRDEALFYELQKFIKF